MKSDDVVIHFDSGYPCLYPKFPSLAAVIREKGQPTIRQNGGRFRLDFFDDQGRPTHEYSLLFQDRAEKRRIVRVEAGPEES